MSKHYETTFIEKLLMVMLVVLLVLLVFSVKFGEWQREWAEQQLKNCMDSK
jgi:hypothetical protein